MDLLILAGVAFALVVTMGVALLGALIALIAVPLKLIVGALGGLAHLVVLPFKILLTLAAAFMLLTVGGCLIAITC